jgi:Zn-dependent metalloprotease
MNPFRDPVFGFDCRQQSQESSIRQMKKVEVYTPFFGAKRNYVLEERAATALPTLLSSSPIEIWNERSDMLLLSTRRGILTHSDNYAQTCYNNFKEVDQFCREIFKQPPVKNNTNLMKGFIDERYAFNNAYWTPVTEGVHFGEIDSQIFNPFVNNFGMTMYAFGHAVTYYSSNLIYDGQSGALRESMADVIAIMAKHRQQKIDANDPNADWFIGENLLVYSETQTAVRSMSNPGTAYHNHYIFKTDPQPAHMQSYIQTTKDFGGVHLNSGIPNKVFYLAATKIGGGSWEKAGQIWFATLQRAKPADDFATFSKLNIAVAQELYGDSISNLVGQAWQEVGISISHANIKVDNLSPIKDFFKSNKYPLGVSAMGVGLAAAYWTMTSFGD